MAASEGPLASLTSDICLDYIETKTDPDIDIGIFFTIIMLVTVAISGFDQE